MEEDRKIKQDNNDELSIDFGALCRKLLKRWKFIVIVTLIFSVLGVAYALKMKRTYSVTMTLAPELQSRSSNSLNALASMLGATNMSLHSTPDALNITLFPEISESTPFLCSLLEVPVTPYVSREQQLEGVKPDTTTVFMHILGRDKTLSPKQEAKRQKADSLYLYDDSVINPEDLTPRQGVAGVTTINVVMDDPMIVKQVADTVCQRLQDFVIKYRTKKATADYEYYVELADEAYRKLVKAQAAYAARVDYDRSVILQSVSTARQRLQDEANLANQIYSQMAQQRELAKAKIQEMKPVYAVVQPATVPLRPSNSRARVCMIFFFAGFFLACLWVAVGEDMVKKFRRSLKDPEED